MPFKKRILISVTNKTGLEQFKTLTDTGNWEIISTGGTERKLLEFNIPVIPVETITGMPEMMGGRIKTLHPSVIGGIIYRRNHPEDEEAIVRYDMTKFDMVVINLYTFEAKPSVDEIDIGGPALLRAAAKNCVSVIPLIDPRDYENVIREIVETGDVTQEHRVELAAKVWVETSRYDHAIANWYLAQAAGANLDVFMPALDH